MIMKRYLQIYLLLLRMNFSALLAYRMGSLNSLISTVGWSIVSIISMTLLTMRSKNIYGWTRDELLVTAGIYIIILGIFHSLFSKNFARFSRVIHLGDLDSILLKPIDSQFLLSMWFFNYTNIFRIIVGIIFTFYMTQKMHVALSIINIGSFLFFSIASVLLFYGVWYSILTITMWVTNLTNLVEFLYSFNYLGRFPPEMITQTRNIFLFLFLPITFFATVPAKVILQRASPIYMILLFFFAFFFLLLSRKFWKFALRHYTSASG